MVEICEMDEEIQVENKNKITERLQRTAEFMMVSFPGNDATVIQPFRLPSPRTDGCITLGLFEANATSTRVRSSLWRQIQGMLAAGMSLRLLVFASTKT